MPSPRHDKRQLAPFVGDGRRPGQDLARRNALFTSAAPGSRLPLIRIGLRPMQQQRPSRCRWRRQSRLLEML